MFSHYQKARRQRTTKIGMIFQHHNLLENLRVYENVALPLKLQRKKEPKKSMIYSILLA